MVNSGLKGLCGNNGFNAHIYVADTQIVGHLVNVQYSSMPEGHIGKWCNKVSLISWVRTPCPPFIILFVIQSSFISTGGLIFLCFMPVFHEQLFISF